jgi:hypothetical protein
LLLAECFVGQGQRSQLQRRMTKILRTI